MIAEVFMEHVTPRDNFFDLLGELEAVVEKGGIVWSEADVLKAAMRLAGLLVQIGRIVDPALGLS
jgi:hypothetical protein